MGLGSVEMRRGDVEMERSPGEFGGSYPRRCWVPPSAISRAALLVTSLLSVVFIGLASAQQVPITNAGGGTLTGEVSESCDHFSIVAGGGPYSLTSGEYVTVTARFAPTEAGPHYCSIETGNTLCSSVECTGVGGEAPGPCEMLSTFEDDEEGWMPLDPGQVTITHMPSGGYPSGYIQTHDVSGGGAVILAPAKFLGDWRELDGVGIVRYDHILIEDGGQAAEGPLWFAIFGAGGKAKYTSDIIPLEGEWNHLSAPIDSASWTINEGTWTDILANVDTIRVGADLTHEHDDNGFDNFYVGLPSDIGHDTCNENLIPDECDTDLDGDGLPDDCLCGRLSAAGPRPGQHHPYAGRRLPERLYQDA
jgi:hypothetical protein